MTTFQVGELYTRRQIHDQVGGSLRECLPHRGGSVVCGAFTPARNPRAPRAVLIGKGGAIERWALVFAAQREPIPVFLKRGSNRWEYAGDYRVIRRAGDRRTIAANAPPGAPDKRREELSMVLFLRRAEARPSSRRGRS